MAAHLLYTSLLESVQKFTTIRKTNKKGNVETSLLKYHIHCFLDTTKSFLANLKLKLISMDYMAKKINKYRESDIIQWCFILSVSKQMCLIMLLHGNIFAIFSTHHPEIENLCENGELYDKAKDSYYCTVCKQQRCKNQKSSVYFAYHLAK